MKSLAFAIMFCGLVYARVLLPDAEKPPMLLLWVFLGLFGMWVTLEK